jgi:hypothetical protein
MTPNEGRAEVGLPALAGEDGNKMNPAPNMTRKEGSKPKGKDE